MQILSVKDFLTLVNETLRLIPSEAFSVEGEVSDFKISQGKWVTFDLKDEKEDAKMPCFGTVYKITIPITQGMRVRVRGRASVFERFGKFSLNVEEVIPVGEGALQKAYLALKKKLEAEGIFDVSRKRQLPQFPERIGLITSKEAAAYGDFIRVLGNRMGGLSIIHADCHVQGQYAVSEILGAFQSLAALPTEQRPQVIVLTRGGGSLEDLHAFNDERVVRAIFSSAIPVVVGVGHERDESLSDFSADVRASTPSNAAEMLTPSRVELKKFVEMAEDRMNYRLDEMLRSMNHSVESTLRVIDHAFSKTSHGVNDTTMRFTNAFDRFRLSVVATREHIERREKGIVGEFGGVLERSKARIDALSRLVQSVDPKRVLDRGYAIVRSAKGLVRDSTMLAPGDGFSVQFAQGMIEAEVTVKKRQERLL
ncbi:MAG: exodeoxyribonuclease VII large subunit [Patescibacteria group bacterium]|jgi:exodeoxyribonuclease VII large subunit